MLCGVNAKVISVSAIKIKLSTYGFIRAPDATQLNPTGSFVELSPGRYEHSRTRYNSKSSELTNQLRRVGRVIKTSRPAELHRSSRVRSGWAL